MKTDWLSVECDTPPDYIMEACEVPSRVGLYRAKDVRWSNLGRFRKQMRTRNNPIVRMLEIVLSVISGKIKDNRICGCGRELPCMFSFTFTLAPENRKVVYRIGQCLRCHSIYWEDA